MLHNRFLHVLLQNKSLRSSSSRNLQRTRKLHTNSQNLISLSLNEQHCIPLGLQHHWLRQLNLLYTAFGVRQELNFSGRQLCRFKWDKPIVCLSSLRAIYLAASRRAAFVINAVKYSSYCPMEI